MFSSYVLVDYMHRLFNEKKKCFTQRQNFLIDAVNQIYTPDICFNQYHDLNLQRFIDFKFYWKFSKNFTISKVFTLGECFSNMNKIP